MRRKRSRELHDRLDAQHEELMGAVKIHAELATANVQRSLAAQTVELRALIAPPKKALAKKVPAKKAAAKAAKKAPAKRAVAKKR